VSFGIRRVAVTTDSGGDFAASFHTYGTLHGVFVEVGDLSTPDVTISDEVRSVDLLAVSGVAADTFYQLSSQLQGDDGADLTGAFGAPAVLGSLSITVAGGGNAKSGTITCLIDR
jgi:hypothetical protein